MSNVESASRAEECLKIPQLLLSTPCYMHALGFGSFLISVEAFFWWLIVEIALDYSF